MIDIKPLHRGWRDDLIELVRSAQEELVIAAPFIMDEGTSLVESNLTDAVRHGGRVAVVTDLSPRHVCDGVLDPEALVVLSRSVKQGTVCHVPSFHAKVYIADGARAIVTSGNLTSAALNRNFEYGVRIADTPLVRSIRADIADIESIGAQVPAPALIHYAATAGRVRESFVRQRSAVDPALRRAFKDAVNAAETELIRLRLAGGAMHTVFAKTIELVLARRGPMSTVDIHRAVQQLHPDLCDDTVDRVIDGKSFGKKWKHAVRTAQQNLKKRGIIVKVESLWSLSNDPKGVLQ